MSYHNSPDWRMDDQSPEDNIFRDGQDLSEEVPFDMLGSGSDEDYSVQTPEQKPTSQKGSSLDHISDTFPSSGGESSDMSAKEGSETMSSSSLSSDAESGSYMPRKKHLSNHVNAGEVLQPVLIELEDENLDMKENLHAPIQDGAGMVKEKGMLYEGLLAQVANYEVELKLEKRLQASQGEVAKLKYENLTLVEELGRTIEKLRTSEGNMKEIEVNIRNEFQEGQDRLNEKLELANQSVEQLQAELAATERRHGAELLEMISKSTNDLNDYCCEVEELKLALHDAQKEFSKDTSQFQSDIACLLDQKDALQTRLNGAEMRQQSLEEQIEQYEVEKMETGKAHEAREAALQDEIRQLQVELSQKDKLLDSLNNSLDACKLKFDMVMAEKDEMLAKLQTLGVEINCRNTIIQQMEEQISKLTEQHQEQVAESQNTQKLVEELMLKVTDQEKELEEHRVSICDRAQEKREAIRQLCFSVEYYRNEFHELRLALMKHKQPAVLSS